MAHYTGQESAKILWDMEKFYDNIQMNKLIAKAIEVEYPLTVFCLGLQMHMAPRAIKSYDCNMYASTPTNGIIAGCTQSNHFARIFLHDIIRATLEGSPYNNITQTQYLVDSPLPIGAWNDIRSFVDDVSQTVRAKMPAINCDGTISTFGYFLTITINTANEIGIINATILPKNWLLD